MLFVSDFTLSFNLTVFDNDMLVPASHFDSYLMKYTLTYKVSQVRWNRHQKQMEKYQLQECLYAVS
jgi:hypothetical protein